MKKKKSKKYTDTCIANYPQTSTPVALPIVKKGVTKGIKDETRIGASLLRLHFHDCFLNVSIYINLWSL